jgi:hypothetical protein
MLGMMCSWCGLELTKATGDEGDEVPSPCSD